MKTNFYKKHSNKFMHNSLSNNMSNTNINNITKGAGEILDKAKGMPQKNLALVIIGAVTLTFGAVAGVAIKQVGKITTGDG